MQRYARAGHPATKHRGDDIVRHAAVTSPSRPAREDARTDAAPLESERLFQMAFERAVIGIAHVSPQGRWLRFNQRLCDFLGYDRAELATRTFQEVTYPDDLEPCLADFQRLLAGEIDEYAMDKRYIHKNGMLVWAHVAVSLVRTPEGAPDFTVTMIQDINERKRLEQEREAARADELATREVNRRMERFLATAAHDLRTPVTATLGFIDLAEHQFQRLADAVAAAARGESPNRGDTDLVRQIAAVRDRLEEADRGAERLARLIEVLFDTAAVHSGKLELHRAPGDLAALVREQVAALRVVAPGRAVRLHAPEAGRPIPVEADADRIGQVVANFLANAVKYAPPDQPIDVSVAARRGQARVAVRDRGPGLPQAERGRVWEPFHRASGVAAATQGGAAGGSLGLGLYICKAIVEAHDGRVGVKSAVGRGSTFWFALPLAYAA